MNTKPRKPGPVPILADQAAYVRIHEASAAVAAEAFMLAAEWGPDEPIPLWPTPAGLAVPYPPAAS
jgi:hypothetical protein